MAVDKLVLDSKALESMGFAEQAVYLIEYDLHSEHKILDRMTDEQKKELKKRNKLAREFRNKLIFLLKFNLKATQHLESCWIIEENRLELAIEGLEGLKEKMKAKGFSDVDERLRIIPIVTTLEGFEHYEEKKAEFLLEFAMEHIKYMEKAKKARRCAKGTIWRCKRAYEIIAELKEELKGNQRYKELKDTAQVLDELTSKVETIIKLEKEKSAQK